MPYVHLTRRYRFSASHRLHTPLLSDEANRAVYGKCNNPYGHGHDYTLEVTIGAEIEPRLGRAVPVEALDALVRTVILAPFDHHDLNSEIDEFATRVPTTEVLAEVAAERLRRAWALRFPQGPARLEKLRIWETRRNIFEVAVASSPRPGNEHEIIEHRREA